MSATSAAAVSGEPFPFEWSKDRGEALRQFEEHLRATGFHRGAEKKRKPRKRVVLPPTTCWEEEFARTIPGRPLCAPDAFELGIYPCKREIALGYPYVQFNRATLFRWLVLDIDRAGAANAWRAAGLPPPNMVMTNPANGHAHLAWLLAVPVSGEPSAKSFRFLAAIEHAYRRRLNADEAFCMHGQVKNPLHADWHTLRIFNTIRFSNAAYSLRELAAPLKPSETKPKRTKAKREAGLGRNVSVFDELREFAYSVVLDFKSFDDRAAFEDQLFDHAEKLNDFRAPLAVSELRSIVKSVAKWTWRKFSLKQFDDRQRALSKRGHAKRWKDHTPLSVSKPWEAEGVSRATWYRQKKANGQALGETLPISERVRLVRGGEKS